jgi:DNA-binding SARP family transcriptional activator
VRFALLGPLSVNDDEGPVKVTGKLRRTLLAALLLDAGTPVSADRLAELLWGPERPRAPRRRCTTSSCGCGRRSATRTASAPCRPAI